MSATIKAYVYETYYYCGFQSGNKKEIWIPSIKAAISQNGEILENIEEARNRGHVDNVTNNRLVAFQTWERITYPVYGNTTKIKIALDKTFVEKIDTIANLKITLEKSKTKDKKKIKLTIDESIEKVDSEIKAVWSKVMDLFD